MKTSKLIQIFKPGTHTAMSGAVLNFTEADMAACAAAYDPAKHEAPIVIGHPKHDGPAYGWVHSLAFADGLEAEPHQVDPAFAEMQAAGRFKKVSASFYTPDSPQNPVPGVYYLRHVGFLGAQPPAVKGLRSPEFSEAEEGVIEFGDWADSQNASLWRRMRDWLIGEKGLDVADSIIPDYTVSNLEEEARKDVPVVSPAFTESTLKGDEMSQEDKDRLAALEAENKKLKDGQIAFAEAEKKRLQVIIHDGHLAFADGLIKAGQLLPAQKDVAVATMDFMAGQETVVEFGEGDAKKPLIDGLKAFLQALPKQVEFSEVAGGGGVTGDVDLSAEALAAKAVEFQEAEARAGRTVSVTFAVSHVKKQGSK